MSIDLMLTGAGRLKRMWQERGGRRAMLVACGKLFLSVECGREGIGRR